jgi:hypothetical protein
MDIYGPAMAGPQRGIGSANARHRPMKTRLAGFVAAACLAGLMVAGCTMPVMKLGKPPLTDRLAELKANESRAKEVLAVLGEPQGRGAVRSEGFGLQDAWLYESGEVDGTKTRMRMLIVFLDKETGVYHGYMWFASGMLIGQTQ